MRPKSLAPEQLATVRRLESALRSAVSIGNCEKARVVTAKLHRLLMTTGHHARLLKAKNWYFECVMGSGDLEKAAAAFQEIRRRSASTTRIHLEATALLAICRLRQDDLKAAESLMRAVLRDEHVISSPRRRREFHARIIQRFDEEAVLAGARNSGYEKLSGKEIDEEAQRLARKYSESELLERIGNTTPDGAVAVLLKIDNFAMSQLPFSERKLLGLSADRLQPREIGRTFFSSAKRVLWRSFCDPSSDVYKVWFNSGMKLVLSKAYIGSAVAATLSGMGIGVKGLAIAISAMIIKVGIEVHCDRYRPSGVMIDMR